MLTRLILLLSSAVWVLDAVIPLRMKPSSPRLVSIGENTVLLCEYRGINAQQNLQYKWFTNNGVEIRIGAPNVDQKPFERLRIVTTNSIVSKLYIGPIEAADAGVWKCQADATNTGESNSVNATLNVFDAIKFGATPLTQNPLEAPKGVIRCDVTGSPNPLVSWRKQVGRIANNPRYTQVAKPYPGLMIYNITTADDGKYFCQAEQSDLGKFLELPITVVVHRPPKITQPPRNQTATAGKTVTFSCAGTGRPTPTYSWYKVVSGVVTTINPSPRHVIQQNTGGYFQIKHLVKIDEGVYQCSASNGEGEQMTVKKRAHLKVIEPPKYVTPWNYTGDENKTASLTCKVSGDRPITLTWTKVGKDVHEEYTSPVNNGQTQVQADPRITVRRTEDSRHTMLTLSIKNAVPQDRSNYTCMASNIGDAVTRNYSIIIQYKPNFSPTPMNVSYSWINAKRNLSCEVDSEPKPSAFEWFKLPLGIPAVDEQNGPKEFRTFHTGRVSMLEITITPGREQLLVRKYSCNATNIKGKAAHIIDLRQALEPGKPAFTIQTTSDSARLTIQRPSDNRGMPVTSFRIQYRQQIGQWQDVNPDANIKKGENTVMVTVPKLNGKTEYSFRVSAKNAVGRGQPTSHSVTTKLPTLPGKVKIISDEKSEYSNQYRLQWTEPNDGGVAITGYYISYIMVKCSTKEEIDKKSIGKDVQQVKSLYIINNLFASSCYKIGITAKNKKGSSNPSFKYIKTKSGPETGRVSDHGVQIVGPSLLSSLALSIIAFLYTSEL